MPPGARDRGCHQENASQKCSATATDGRDAGVEQHNRIKLFFVCLLFFSLSFLVVVLCVCILSLLIWAVEKM